MNTNIHDQHIDFFDQHVLKLLAAIAKIADGNPAISGHQQIRRWNTIINIGGRQDEIDDSSCDVLESMQFENKESTFLCFPKTSPILAHQPHAAERMADGDRLGVNQVEFWLGAFRESSLSDWEVKYCSHSVA